MTGLEEFIIGAISLIIILPLSLFISALALLVGIVVTIVPLAIMAGLSVLPFYITYRIIRWALDI